MLCGISSRFQLLSPAQGQVAHALLTRPPLTRPRRASSVRLECVMHAASVHPEPGSNSQTICISSAVAVRSFLSELFYSSFFLLFRVVYSLFLTDLYFALAYLLCTSIFCCSIVKLQFRAPFCRALVYYITAFLVCQYLFEIFFKIFLTSSSAVFLRPRSRDSFSILPLSSSFVKSFFSIFIIL